MGPPLDRRVAWWGEGLRGAPALSNLVLLCRCHHSLVHEGGFGLAMTNGNPEFRRPDGTVIADRPPPQSALAP